jgi:hypothetical protein
LAVLAFEFFAVVFGAACSVSSEALRVAQGDGKFRRAKGFGLSVLAQPL